MCVPLGVDPLSTSKSFWGAMLGLGEFYYELSVKVAEVCIASRSRNGGIIRYDSSMRHEHHWLLVKRGFLSCNTSYPHRRHLIAHLLVIFHVSLVW